MGMNYHMAIDMWSLGCIMAELYTGFPIFPGENEQEQLSCIMEVLGVPDKDFINRSSRKKLFFGENGMPNHDHFITDMLPGVSRPKWCPPTGRKLEGASEKTRDEDPRASPSLRRRALRRLHCEVPDLGSGATDEAAAGAPAPVRAPCPARKDHQPRAEQLQVPCIDARLEQPQQARRDAEEVADQRAHAAHSADEPHELGQCRINAEWLDVDARGRLDIPRLPRIAVADVLDVPLEQDDDQLCGMSRSHVACFHAA